MRETNDEARWSVSKGNLITLQKEFAIEVQISRSRKCKIREETLLECLNSVGKVKSSRRLSVNKLTSFSSTFHDRNYNKDAGWRVDNEDKQDALYAN